MAVNIIERKQAKLASLISTMVIDSTAERTWAILQSCTNAATTYEVTVDESYKVRKMPYAVDCTCEGHVIWHKVCAHMQAVDLFYAGIVKMFTIPVVEGVSAPTCGAGVVSPLMVTVHTAPEDVMDFGGVNPTRSYLPTYMRDAKPLPNAASFKGTLNGNRPFSLPKSYAQIEAEKKKVG